MLASPDNEHELFTYWPSPSQCPPEKLAAVTADETEGHIHIHRLDFSKAIGWPAKVPFLGHWLQARLFVKRAKACTVDILHGHSPLACAIASHQLKRKKNLPALFEVHRIMGDFSNPPVLPGPLKVLAGPLLWIVRKLLRRIEGRILRQAEVVIAHSDSAKRRLMELYGLDAESIVAISNGVDSQRFDPARWAQAGQALRRERDWGDRLVCLYAGRLDEVNGTKFWLESLRNLGESERKNLQVVIIGRGPLSEYVARYAQAHSEFVEYLGPVEYETMPKYYAACDVVLIPCMPTLPSEVQPPTKLQESMAMARIVLASNVGSITEVIEDGVNGYLFDKHSDKSFIDKLRFILMQPADIMKPLGERAREKMVREYTWERSRKLLQDVYEGLARKKT